MPLPPARRRSTWWQREMKSVGLHRLAGKLYNEFQCEGLTPAQDHTLSGCISELEYRNRRLAAPDRCTCMFCTEPFPDDICTSS